MSISYNDVKDDLIKELLEKYFEVYGNFVRFREYYGDPEFINKSTIDKVAYKKCITSDQYNFEVHTPHWTYNITMRYEKYPKLLRPQFITYVLQAIMDILST